MIPGAAFMISVVSVHEPMTLATDYLLGMVVMVVLLAIALAYPFLFA